MKTRIRRNLRRLRASLASVWLLAGLAAAASAPVQTPSFNSVTPNSASVAMYELFELTIDLAASYSNPYDYDEIRIECVFLSPSGRKDVVDGFFMQDYTLNPQEGSLSEVGRGAFRVRYAPDQTGTWQYVLSCTTRSGTGTFPVRSFQCVPARSAGFIRRNASNYLGFDNGDQYIPVGENLGWYENHPYFNYRDWTRKLADQKANYIRVWQCPWGLGLEWKDGVNGYFGLKRYKQTTAFYFDWLLGECRDKGIYVILCLNHHGMVSTTVNTDWPDSPYNSVNGGPCLRTWDFFTDPSARAFQKNRLRYTVARWGFARNLLAWELFNEVDWTDEYEARKDKVREWHTEMAGFIKSRDTQRHLVTTSFAHEDHDPGTWESPLLDFTQTHFYLDSANLERELSDGAQRYLEVYGKPTLNVEFGFTTKVVDFKAIDSDGVFLHNVIWGATFSGAMGSAMTWFWPQYVDQLNLYRHFRPLSEFVGAIRLKDDRYAPVAVEASGGGVSDLTVTPTARWGDPTASDVEIDESGNMTPGSEELSEFLYGSVVNRQFRNPPTFHMTFPTAGQFMIVTGPGTSKGPRISIAVDGRRVFDEAASVNTTYSIRLGPGPHTIRVDNLGFDWISIGQYIFSPIASPLDTYFLKSADSTKAAGWVHNKRYNWKYVQAKGLPAGVAGATLVIPGIKDGTYSVNFTDCETGASAGSLIATATRGSLTIPLPHVAWDLAVTATLTVPAGTI